MKKILIGVVVVLVFVVIAFWGYTQTALERGLGDSASLDCARNPEPSSFAAAPYYAGPLFETHLHIPSALPPPKIIRDKLGLDQEYATLGGELTIQKIVCLMDRENITRAVAFFPLVDFPFMRGPFIEAARRTVEAHNDRIIPFLLPVPFTAPAPEAETLAKIFDKNKGLYKGYGEIPFYWDEYNDLSPDDPQFLESFNVLGERGLFAMIHPDDGQIPALETVFTDNPEVTFILHGMNPNSPFNYLLSTYPNVYYTLDSPGLDPFFRAQSKEEFLQDMENNFHGVLARAVADWKSMVEANPEKVLWGTDRFSSWSFDDEVGVVLEEYSRAFIGRLSPRVQEMYAHKNAERLFSGESSE